MDVISHLESEGSFKCKIEVVQRLLKKLRTDVSSSPITDDALDQYILSLWSRIEQIAVIGGRLYQTRYRLLEAHLIQDLVEFKKGPIEGEYKNIFERTSTLGKLMEVDYQSALLFIAITLDEWAIVTAYCVQASNPSSITFHKIIERENNEPYTDIWNNHKESMLWLNGFPRLFRNKLIVHRDQPWTMGSSFQTKGMDWQFCVMDFDNKVSSDNAVAEAMMELRDMANHNKFPIPENNYDMMFELLNNIQKFEAGARATILRVAKIHGYKLPTFQVVLHHVTDFLIASLATNVSKIEEAIRFSR